MSGGLNAVCAPAFTGNGGASEVSQAELAKALNLDRSATSRRVATAINHGYVKNIEDRKGRPARLVLGDPMPDEIDMLPTPQALSDALLHRCGVDAPPRGRGYQAP